MTSYPDNFSRAELLRSNTALRNGIDNTPSSPKHETNLVRTAYTAQFLRDALSRHYRRDIPLAISSGYRSEALNMLVGGSKRSAHSHGLAIDFRALTLTVEEVCDFIMSRRDAFDFDQVINEYGQWVHLGIERPGTGEIRKQFLLAKRSGGRTVYTPLSVA